MRLQIKRKYIYIAVGFWLLSTTAYFTLCKIASEHALHIFNKAMTTQKVLKGSVSVGSIDADIWGQVDFADLVWLDTDGEPIVQVPQGSFKVRPWDVITGNISTATLKELELNNALFAVRFNRKMQLDIFKQAQAERAIASVGQQDADLDAAAWTTRQSKADGAVKQPRTQRLPRELNLNLADKKIKMQVTFNHCTFAAGYRQRYFVLNDVNAKLDLDLSKKIAIDFATGKFGGTMVGDGLQLKGDINLQSQIPICNLQLNLYNVLPSSLGIGDIKDTVSIVAAVTGELPSPVVDGALHFNELDIPGLHFTEVNGDLHYENAMLKFTNVTGNVFGGTVEAFGDYNLDNRHYNIDALGHELMASIAARSTKINCRVELEFKIRSKGDPRTALTYGSFKSGAGNYYIFPFDSISGEFSNQNKLLEFKNVVLKMPMGNVRTDKFQLVDGKLHIGTIVLEKPENGQTININE